MSAAALNFKPYDKGSLRGFFDLRYYGLTIKGCRLMNGNGGLWIALPQKEIDQDGERKWIDQLYLTAPEMDHVRKLVVADLASQGHIPNTSPERRTRPQAASKPASKATIPTARRTPEGEDLSEFYSNPGDDDNDIPF